MLQTHPRMKRSREEEAYLRHWMFDEARYQEGQGPAKQLFRGKVRNLSFLRL
jgi:hypothetical protein